MTLALRLAERGLYTTHPNPRVGCVIVKDQKIIGQGAHLIAGEPHAEVYALHEAGADADGATAYVTLEPCSHHGRTPPCADALVKAGVARVVIAMLDPNPLVAGEGAKRLEAQGMQVEVGLMQKEAQALNPGFISRMVRKVPYVRSKIAASLDGKTALNNGKSQWITGDAARHDVQHWRAQSSAIITGVGTVLMDDPTMNVRLDNISRQPLRIILDSHLRTPVPCKMLQSIEQAPVLIVYSENGHDSQARVATLEAAGAQLLYLPATAGSDKSVGQVDLNALLQYLAKAEINDVLLEAGQGLNGAFLKAGLIDEFIFYYAAQLMGSAARGMFGMPELVDMQRATALQITDVRQFDQDIRIMAKPSK